MITHWWLGAATQTTAVVVARADTTATVTLTCNGTTYTASADTTVRDGITRLTVTGLVAGQSYDFTLTQGATVTGQLKTLPSGRVRIAWGSCLNKDRDLLAGYQIIDQYAPDLFVAQGDWPYTEWVSNRWGEPVLDLGATLANAKNLTEFYRSHRQVQNIPGVRYLTHRAPFYYQVDDHEWPVDNWDNQLSTLQARFASATATDLANVNAVSRTSALAYAYGNPDNTDSGVDADPLYYRQSLGEHADVFFLDCISHRSGLSAVDDASKTLLGANQKAWLKAQLQSSTKPFKIISSPKKLYNNATDNTDTWNYYTTERAEILNFIQANGINSVIWLAGDRHCPDVSETTSPAHVAVNACPISVENNTNAQGAGYQTGVVWKAFGPNGVEHRNVMVFGICDIYADRVELALVDVTGPVLWRGRVLAGSNTLDRTAGKVVQQ